uniref:Uncharacterized protein n=1 Tax=Timema shepardi TaxID=629360 RepID=A0A7R9G3Y6_TIMSH|nr:unnamed protein product [Timema shepardi]
MKADMVPLTDEITLFAVWIQEPGSYPPHTYEPSELERMYESEKVVSNGAVNDSLAKRESFVHSSRSRVFQFECLADERPITTMTGTLLLKMSYGSLSRQCQNDHLEAGLTDLPT